MYRLPAKQRKSLLTDNLTIQTQRPIPFWSAVEKEKPSLLLITGWAHGPEAVLPVADALATDYTVQILTGTQVLNDRSIPPVDYIVTGSMGGLLAIELLPATCRKLVLLSSTAKFCSDSDYPCGTHPRIINRMIRQLKCDPEAVLETFFRNVHYPHPIKPSAAQRQDSSSTLDHLVAGLEYLRDADVRGKIPETNIPVLLMHGTDDRIIPVAAAEWLNDHLPDRRLRTFENGGHALLAHHFEEALAEINGFLNPEREN